MSAVETTTEVSSGTADLTEAGHARRVETSGPSNPRRRRRYLHDPAPWRRSDVTRALVLVAVGIAVGVWGWWRVSGEARLHEQVGWAVVSALGAAICGCGGVYLVTVAMRGVRLGQRQLMFDMADMMGWTVTVTGRGRLRLHAVDETLVAEGETTLVVGPGMTIAHRGECPIARGKAVVAISAADAVARGLGSCGVCA